MQATDSSLSIMVIEDNPGDRRLIEIALRELADGSRKAGAIDSFDRIGEGLDKLRGKTGKPDVILLDLGLPDVSGFDGLLSLRDVDPTIPVIVLTGLSDEARSAEALQLGASDYLEKGELNAKALWRAIRYSLERKKHEAALIHLANTDPLTGLLNRRAFFEQLDWALDQVGRADTNCAAVVFDIDNFKDVNDAYGHHIGDQLLREIAGKVPGSLRKTDIVGRIGGDEFAVVVHNLKAPSGALDVAEKISRCVEEIRNVSGIELLPTTSVGISIPSSTKMTAEALISQADMAMYKSKKNEVGTKIHYYDSRMDYESKQRFLLKRSILGDIERNRFFLEYQPIVAANTEEIVGAEALARWRGAGDRLIPPGEFVPVAEESGWIAALGQRLLEYACCDLRDAIAIGGWATPVSLNVSAVQCRDPGFGAAFVETVKRYGVASDLIKVEITETTLVENVKTTRKNLEVLKDAGVGVHIDDFGTGYSSLSILKDLPIDGLKIDRSFVDKIATESDSLRIVQAIADLARALGLKTVAEGAETMPQIEALRAIGVDFIQGYYYCRPVSFGDFKGRLPKAVAEAGWDVTEQRVAS